MTATLRNFWPVATDANGNPVSGAKVYVFQENTSTPVTTYVDAGKTTPHAHPIVCDSAGVPPNIWLADGAYTVEVRHPTTSAELPGSPFNMEAYDQSDMTARIAAAEAVSDGLETRIETVERRAYATHALAQAAAVAGDIAAGDVVDCYGYAAAGDGGHARYVVQAADDALLPGAGRLKPIDDDAGAALWGVLGGGAISIETGEYVVSGDDEGDELQAAINRAMRDGHKVRLPKGVIRAARDIYMRYDPTNNAPTGLVAKSDNQSGLDVEGAGEPTFDNIQWRVNDNGARTIIALDDGYRVLANAPADEDDEDQGPRSVRLGGFGLIGRVTTGALFYGGRSAIQHGGGGPMAILNDLHSDPGAAVAAYDMQDFYHCRLQRRFLAGRYNYRAIWKDDTKLGQQFWGDGFRMRPKNGGTQGVIELCTASGFDVCGRFGYDASATATYSQVRGLTLDHFQASYGNFGVMIGKGVTNTTLYKVHLEYLIKAGLLVANGAGAVRVVEGKIDGLSRKTDANAIISYMKYGAVVVGHWDGGAAGHYSDVTLDSVRLDNIEQYGVVVYGAGDNGGLVLLDGVYFEGAGSSGLGGLIGIDETNGEADVIVRNPRTSYPVVEPDWAGRLCSTFTTSTLANGEPGQHNRTNAPLLIRVEQAAYANAAPAMITTLDANTSLRRKNIPTYIRADTDANDVTLTVGPETRVGQDCLIEKFKNTYNLYIRVEGCGFMYGDTQYGDGDLINISAVGKRGYFRLTRTQEHTASSGPSWRLAYLGEP